MKIKTKREAATLIAVIMLVVGAFALTNIISTKETRSYEGLSYPTSGTVLRASAKAHEVLMSKQDTAYERAVAYARNIRIDLFGEQGDILASNLVSGNGHVSLSDNSAEYIEGDVYLYIDNLELGTVNVSVQFQGKVVVVSFTATTDGGTGANRLNVVDIYSYALPEEQRNIMDPSNGYHENILDSEGNIQGSIDRAEITGTVEADERIDSTENVEKVQTSVGERVHSTPVATPTPTPEATPAPEVEEEEVKETVIEHPVITPEPTPTPIPTPTPEATPEVEEVAPTPTPEVEAIPESTPEPNEIDQSADQEKTKEDASEIGIELSNQYARIFILTGTETVTIFGNGTENLIIEGSLEMTDLGNGFVSTPYGVFAR